MAELKEIGRTGLTRYGGIIYDEFLPELQGVKGVQVYREMSNNDSTVGAILFAIKNLIRQANWSVRPAGKETKDSEAAEFVESCLHDMQMTWTDTISEILSFLTYGWSVHELVYKRRMGRNKNPQLDSKYSDGLIGWQKLPIRSQASLYEWEYDEHDNLTGFKQMPPPSYRIIRIPMEKLLLFRTESHRDNPEGKSILRSAYRSYYFKKRIQEIEGIGIERDLAGYPVLIAPEGVDVWSSQGSKLLAICDQFVKSIRRNESEGLTLPAGWELKLLSTGGTRQFDTSEIIRRYDVGIAQTVLADFIFLGQNSVGSFALSSDKTALFSMAIGAFLDIICETMNRKAIPQLLDLNSKQFSRISGYPELIHGDIETADLAKLGEYLKTTVGLGLITPDETLEDYVREQADLPPRME